MHENANIHFLVLIRGTDRKSPDVRLLHFFDFSPAFLTLSDRRHHRLAQ